MKVGKWFIMFRIGNLGFGLGRPPQDILAQADLTRPHRGL